MTSEIGFVDNVLKAFRNIIREIEKGSSEHDVRYRFVKYFVEEVLGYEPKYIKWERKRADLTVIDKDNFAVIKIETKRPTESIDKIQHKEQAFKYEEEITKFIGLTNFLQFKLWEVKKTGSELRINLDFSKILEQRKPIEKLSGEEKSQILFLNNLTKDTLFDPSKYEKFDETYARIDITKDAGFRKLLDRLNFIANRLLLGYTPRAFGEYKEGYTKYQNELKELSEISKNEKNGYMLAKAKQKIEEKYSKYRTFGGYYLWKEYSGKENVSDNEAKEIFCKESIYVLLNKLLFIRICEDKQLLEKNISNGGIEELRAMLKKRFNEDVINRELLEIAFKSARTLYAHFYETGILDWFRTGDGELNELLNRVLWILNQFDFTHVDRDILGNLYEKYLPSGERKRLGEFYTPTEVIDYILTSVGYTYSHDIETKDLLDPACGSGGFLVRATRRLISRYLMKFGKTDKKELRNPKNWKDIANRLSSDEAKIILESVQEHIYGLDINPFACHIAEMNMLFQVIDLYKKTKEKYSDFKLKRFKIYQTDSLELPRQKNINDFGNHLKFLKEQEEIDAIKRKKFDFVVGNPPYVRQEKIKSQKNYYEKEYFDIYDGRADLYIYFIRRGISWTKEKGKLGYIVSGKFIKSGYGKYIRAYLVTSTIINGIIDLRGTKIFKEATNDPIILLLTNSKPHDDASLNVVILKKEVTESNRNAVLKKTIDEIFKAFGKRLKNEFVRSYQKKQKILASELKKDRNNKRIYAESWDLTPFEIHVIRDKIIKNSNERLSEICDVYRGIRTGANKVFVITQKDIKNYRIESKFLKKLIEGKNIKKWFIEYCNLYILYPNLPSVDIKKYPNTFSYLSRFKDDLERRAQYKERKKKGEDIKWYEIEQPLSGSILENPKIITQRISNQYGFAFDDGIFYTLETCSTIVPKEQDYTLYILGILNSRLMEFFTKTDGKALGKKGYEFEKQFLDRIPIKLPSTPEEKKIAGQIIKKVDEILKLNKQEITDIDSILQDEETEKLSNLSKVSFSLRDDAKFEKIKLEGNKIFINSVGDFIEIKDKKILDFVRIYLTSISEKLSKTKDAEGLILNLSVPKSDEILKEIIKKGGADQLQIKDKIKKLEKEINELVYQIYGIKKEERKIVEENL